MMMMMMQFLMDDWPLGRVRRSFAPWRGSCGERRVLSWSPRTCRRPTAAACERSRRPSGRRGSAGQPSGSTAAPSPAPPARQYSQSLHHFGTTRRSNGYQISYIVLKFWKKSHLSSVLSVIAHISRVDKFLFSHISFSLIRVTSCERCIILFSWL